MGGEAEYAEADQDFSDGNRTYQAASPDEVSRGLLDNQSTELITLGFSLAQKARE